MNKNIQIALVSTALALLSTLPYFYLDYGVHNDYRALDHPHTLNLLSGLKELMWHDESMHLMYIGRPINAILFNLQQFTINTLSDLKLWRVVSCLTLLAALANFCLVSVCRAKSKMPWVVFSYVLIFLAPPSQLYINWVANYVPGSLNILVLSFAAILLSIEATKIYLRWFFWISALFLIFLSDLNYPATSSAVIIPSVVSFFYRPDKANCDYLARSLAFYLTGLVLYFLLHKLFMFDFLSEYFLEQFKSYDTSTYNFGIGFNFAAPRILMELLIAAFTSTFYATFKYFSILLVLGLLVVIAAKNYVYNQLKTYRCAVSNFRKWHRLKIICFAVLITILPIIAAPNGFFAYRVFFTPLAVATLFFSYGTYILYLITKPYLNVSRAQFIVIACMLVSANALLQNRTYAMQSYTEYNFIKNGVQNSAPFNKIVVVLPSRYQDFVNSDLYSDLKYTATNYSGFMKSIVYFATDEIRISRDSYSVESANSFYSDGFKIDSSVVQPGTLLIDMNALKASLE